MNPGITRWKIVPSYSGTPCLLAPLTGFFQSLVPEAKPMKLATPMGALSGKSVQVILPAVVSIIAVGLVVVVAGWAVVLGLAAACPAGLVWDHAIEPATKITPKIAKVPRIMLLENRDGLSGAQRCIVRQAPLFRGLGPQLAAHALHLSNHAQPMTTENFVDVLGAVAAIEQRLRDLRQIGSRIDPLRCGA